jgi:hypothetical protein
VSKIASLTELARNNVIFTKALWKLVTILSNWPRRETSRSYITPGITLDLGALSPSDCEHAVRYFRLDESYPYLTEEDLPQSLSIMKWSDSHLAPDLEGVVDLDESHKIHKQWPDEWQLSYGARARLLGRGPLTLDIDALGHESGSKPVFPEAVVVENLILRRQYYRHIAPDALRKLFSEAFTSVRSFRHEFWVQDVGTGSWGYGNMRGKHFTCMV